SRRKLTLSPPAGRGCECRRHERVRGWRDNFAPPPILAFGEDRPLPASRERGERAIMTAIQATRSETPAAGAATILAVNNIEVVYDRVILVLKGVSLEVTRGGIVALLGANGAGKTTTLKAVSNLLHSERGEVTKGSIVFDG